MIHDAAARDAALSVDRSFIVQAPAGSGKTGLLVYRMLRLLATVEQPQQVLAITFTRKATAEMRERLIQLMHKAELGQTGGDVFEQQGIDLASKVLERDKAQDWQLLNTPYQLQILTIDSFCAKLTTSMPWLSRLGDRPRMTDNAEGHYAVAVEQLFAELLETESPISKPLQTVLQELDFNYDTARSLFISMLAKRDQWLRYLLRNDLTGLRENLQQTWQTIVDMQLAVVNNLLSDVTVQTLLKLGSNANEFLAKQDSGKKSPFDALSFASQSRPLNLQQYKALAVLLLTADSKAFRKTVDKRQGFAAGSAEKKLFVELLKEFAADRELLMALQEIKSLPEPTYNDNDWQQLIALEAVLKSLAARLQLRFRAVGECDHSEVTQRANLALQELDSPTDLGLRMDYHLQHILVDEFQDTSNGQIDLLKKLTAGWHLDVDAAPKTLFLVGDPMQSIYRFREADVSLFLQVAENANSAVFENLSIEPLQLTENFRSSSNLVDWFNSTFSSSFPADNHVLTGAIKYASASSKKDAFPDCVTYGLAHNKTQEAELLVQAVTQAIGQLPNDHTSQPQVAILVRSRSQLDYFLPALQAAGIPYAGVDIQPLREQQAVIDVLALCKAICREGDRVSWLALLRGPWCGLSLAEIKQWLGRPDQTIWQQLISANFNSLEADSRTRLTAFVEVMRETMQQRQQVELGSLSRWAWRSLGGEQTLFGANPDDIETVFELIDGLQRAGDLSSMNDLDKALDGLFAKPVKRDIDKVRVVVSTMHKSKGLQFDTVILPGLANPPRNDEKAILMWAEHQNRQGDSSLLLAPLRLTPQESGHYDYLRKLENKRSANEAVRLMYVAATRAERQLILIGRAKSNPNTGEARPPHKNSLLSTVWEPLRDNFIFSEALEKEPRELQEISQTLVRLPSGYKTPFAPSIDWQVEQQLNTQESLLEQSSFEADLFEQGGEDVVYDWATEVATGVGIVLHEFLQYQGENVLSMQVDTLLLQRWRAELLALRVPVERIGHAVKRLARAVENIQRDQSAHFLFADYPEQHNEYTLSAFEDGHVNKYRIDRTFVDHKGVRWIVDYKSTDTRNNDIEPFVDEQVEVRHRGQLEKYGALMKQIDARPIQLAVYFPMLKQLRSWRADDQA